MSPEQARGKIVDKRADIWAFGCVLYEMLTGRFSFPGETVSDVLVAILEHDPDWTALPQATPESVRRLLHRCLEKNPKQRLRDIGDARIDLDGALSGAGQVEPIIAQKRRWSRVLAAAAVLTILSVMSMMVIWNRTVARPTETVVNLQRITDFVGIEEHPAVSPDGKTVAFIAPTNGRRQVWVRLLAGGPPLQLTRDDADHEHPRWAPDSNSLIYFSGAGKEGDPGTLWEVSSLGGHAAPDRLFSRRG